MQESFNPTMVRLLLEADHAERLAKVVAFNPTMVRLLRGQGWTAHRGS